MKKLLITLFLVLWASVCFATTTYVKKIGSTVYYEVGAASCDAVTSADTAGDIDAALGNVDGNTLYICPGTYTGTDLDSDSSIGVSAGEDGCTIMGSTGVASDVILDGGDLNGVILLAGNDITLKHLTIQNADGGTSGVGLQLGGNGTNIVENIKILNCYKGVSITTTTAAVSLSQFSIIDYDLFGIQNNSDTTVTVQNGIIMGKASATGADGIYIQTTSGNFSGKNLIIAGNTGAALRATTHAGTSYCTNCAVISNGYKDGSEPTWAVDFAGGSFTLNNCLTHPSVWAPDTQHISSATDGGGNIGITEGISLPKFTSSRYPIKVAIAIDDFSSFTFLQELAVVAADFGFPLSFGINGTDERTAGEWASLASYYASAPVPIEYSSHCRSCSNLTTGADCGVDAETDIKQSKLDIEAGLLAAGLSYTVKTFVCPGNATNAAVQQFAQEAGYTGARGASTYANAEQSMLVRSSNIFKVYCANPHNDIIGATNIRRNTAMFLEHLGNIGGTVVFFGHEDGDGSANYTTAEWRVFFEELKRHPNVEVMLFSDLVDWLKTYDPSSDLAAADNDSDTTNVNETYTRTMVDNSNFMPLIDSVLINAGIDVGLSTDYAGNPIKGPPDIGAYEFQSGVMRVQ